MEKKEKNTDFLIVLDPIDGKTNFYYKIGFFAITLALVYKGITVLGIVYNPLTKEFYHAILGEGAYLNNKEIESMRIRFAKLQTYLSEMKSVQMRIQSFAASLSQSKENKT
jgi:fructose-1,6-bisphosphatase/inositol monophosphatase family enzyme